MSSNPRKEPQVFISYAHLDNKPIQNQPGWVDLFDESLSVYLSELLGGEAAIWRDRKLAGNDYITETIITSLCRAHVIVAIISPRYIRSDWCLREAQEFCKKNFRADGHGRRVFKVLKLPITNEIKYFKDQQSFDFYNQALHDLKGYEFYQIKNQKLLRFRFELGPEPMQKFLDKIGDLAQDIAERIHALEEEAKVEPAGEDVVVYLAETTADLTVERDRIKRELIERRYIVLPDEPLPLEAKLFNTAVTEYLRRSSLSIHLVGHEYGDSPIGEKRSIVELQNALATARTNDPGFSQLIWIAPKPQSATPLQLRDLQQTRFIKELLDSNSEQVTELIQDSLENFKTTILDRITAPAPVTQAAKAHRTTKSNLVYVICDTRDTQKAEELRQLITSQGCDVVLPSTGTNDSDLRLEHEALLISCDSVLIYWGGATTFWVRLKLQDLQKIFGEGRTVPFRTKVLYAGASQTSDKENFSTNEAVYIKNFDDEITIESLSPLFQTIGKAEGEIA